MKYPFEQKGRGNTFLAIIIWIIIGIVIGIAAGYFGNIYITEAYAYFSYKSMIIGAVSGLLTGLIVSVFSGSKHRYY